MVCSGKHGLDLFGYIVYLSRKKQQEKEVGERSTGPLTTRIRQHNSHQAETTDRDTEIAAHQTVLQT